MEIFIIKSSKKLKTKVKYVNVWVTMMLNGNVSVQCNPYRDKNAVHNMLNIVQSIFNTGKRPIKFTRDNLFPLHDGINNHK